MARQRQRKPNYSPEFMAKAVDIALASILPDKEVARGVRSKCKHLSDVEGVRG